MCGCVCGLDTPGVPGICVGSGGAGFDNPVQLNVIDLRLPSLKHRHPHLGQTRSLSNQFCNEADHTVRVCVCVHLNVHRGAFNTFPQVTNHRVSDDATAVDRLTRST